MLDKSLRGNAESSGSMASARKTLTVSYGTFSCTLEGFDDAFATMKEVAQYFRELSAEDRYFGAVPPTPDAETLKRIAEKEVRRRVEATLQDKKVFLRATGDAEGWVEQEPPRSPPPMPSESVAARLARLRSTISRRRAEEGEAPPRSIFADDEEGGGEPEPPRPLSGPPPGVPDAAAAQAEQREAGGAAAGSLTEPAADVPEPDVPEPDMPEPDMQVTERPEAAAPGDRHTDRAGTATADGPGDAGDAPPSDESAQPEPAGSKTTSVAEAGSEAANAEPQGDAAPEVPAQAVSADREAMRALQAEALAQAFSDEDAEGAGADAADGPAGFEASPPEMTEDRDADGEANADSELAGESRSLGADAPDTPAERTSEERESPDTENKKAEPSDATGATGRSAAQGVFPGSGAAVTEAGTETRAEQQLRNFFSRLRHAGTGAARGGEGRVAPRPVPAPDPARPPAVATDERGAPAGERPGTEPAEPVSEPPVEPASAAQEAGDVVQGTSGLPGTEAPAETARDAAMPVEPAEATAEADRPESQAGAAPDAPETAPDAPETLLDSPEPEPEAGAEPDDESRPRPRDGRTILETTNGASTDDDSVARLVETAKTRLEVAESQRRLAAFSHLKAAVAAPKADRMMGTSQEEEDARKDEAEIGRYRDDLSRAVQGGDASEDGPLRLEEAQRRRDAGTAGDAVATGGGISGLDDDAGDAGDPGPSGGGSTPSRPFPDYAREAGVSDLPDLLEAAAAYLTEEEGRPLFSRPQIMRKVALMASEEDFSREDGLRAFGALLRQGRIQKVRRGQFSISRSSRFVRQGNGLPN